MSNILPPGDATDVAMPRPMLENDTVSSEPQSHGRAGRGVP